MIVRRLVSWLIKRKQLPSDKWDSTRSKALDNLRLLHSRLPTTRHGAAKCYHHPSNIMKTAVRYQCCQQQASKPTFLAEDTWRFRKGVKHKYCLVNYFVDLKRKCVCGQQMQYLILFQQNWFFKLLICAFFIRISHHQWWTQKIIF